MAPPKQPRHNHRILRRLIAALLFSERQRYAAFLLGHDLLLALQAALRSLSINLGLVSFIAEKWSNVRLILNSGFYITALYGIISLLLLVYGQNHDFPQKYRAAKYKTIARYLVWLPLRSIRYLAELMLAIILAVLFYALAAVQQLSV